MHRSDLHKFRKSRISEFSPVSKLPIHPERASSDEVTAPQERRSITYCWLNTWALWCQISVSGHDGKNYEFATRFEYGDNPSYDSLRPIVLFARRSESFINSIGIHLRQLYMKFLNFALASWSKGLTLTFASWIGQGVQDPADRWRFNFLFSAATQWTFSQLLFSVTTIVWETQRSINSRGAPSRCSPVCKKQFRHRLLLGTVVSGWMNTLPLEVSRVLWHDFTLVLNPGNNIMRSKRYTLNCN